MQPDLTPLGSAIYIGEVWHRRAGTRPHNLKYPVAYLLLDLDEAAALARRSRLFGYNQRAWFSFHDADHGAGDGRPFGTWLSAVLAEAGIGAARWRFRVLCLPRVLGYAFNPISVVYCHRPDGSLGAMVYEVNNTFGERHAYVVPVTTTGTIAQRCDKALFVSPFFDMAGHYEFTLSRPDERLSLTIDYFAADELRLRAGFSGNRKPFDAATLRMLARRFPLMSLKVVAAIHLEALKLWLKGVPLARRGGAPAPIISLGTER